MDNWMVQVGVAVGLWALHAMFAHGGDFGETWECDRQRELEYQNMQFQAMTVMLTFAAIFGIAYLAYEGWKEYCRSTAVIAAQTSAARWAPAPIHHSVKAKAGRTSAHFVRKATPLPTVRKATPLPTVRKATPLPTVHKATPLPVQKATSKPANTQPTAVHHATAKAAQK